MGLYRDSDINSLASSSGDDTERWRFEFYGWRDIPTKGSLVRKRGKLVVVIEDDALVLDSTGGELRKWGCRVVAGDTFGSVFASLGEHSHPDLIISDCRLANGQSGTATIPRLRAALGINIPAFLLSGDTAPECLREARASGHHLLHKPVRPMRLRAMVSQLLQNSNVAGAA